VQGGYGFPSTRFAGVQIVTIKACCQVDPQDNRGVRPRGEDAQPQRAAGQASKQGPHSPLAVSVLGW